MALTFARERLLHCLEEAKPLMEQHWREIDINHDVAPLDMDFVRYAQLEERGKLLIVTAREDGVLCGYAVYLIDKPAHHRKTKWAETDAYWLRPDLRGGRGLRSRGYGKALMDFAENELRAEGVKIIHARAKNAHPAAGRLWQAMGYGPVETVYAKVL